jgi:hypothetical protein
MPKKVIHLILKAEWYDAIDNGSKRIEYRDNTSYWRPRITGAEGVVFHRGYTNTTMRFTITDIKIGTSPQIEIHLGDRQGDVQHPVYKIRSLERHGAGASGSATLEDVNVV